VISWTFALSALILAIVPQWLPPRGRALAVAALSAAALVVVWSPPIAPILAASLAVYGLGRVLPRLSGRAQTALLWGAIAAILSTLVAFRAAALGRTTLVAGTAVLGLSYFSLKFIQHLVDATGPRPPASDLPGFMASILFLPTFSAGPIERTGDFGRELARPVPPWSERVLGVERVLFGLAKKLLLGDPLLAFAEPILRDPWHAARGALWLGAYALTLALYLDFAGYSDIAIGAAQCAGLKVRENFDSPFLARNLNLLWQRWHMSLTGWLRDFLFVPIARRMLRLTKRPFLSQATAQTATMLACGLWHGLAWNFAAWGLYHAGALTGLAAWRSWRGPAPKGTPVRDALSTLLTFHVFAFGAILFGAELHTALVFLGRMVLVDRLWAR
jgi:alginate O-acetyltransferase complex protein AlgI